MCRCPGVLWCLAISSAAAYIADTYTVSIMAGAVCAYLLYRSASVYAAVPIYYVVVAYTFPAALTVPAVYIAYSVVAPLRGRTTVYYNLRYLSHTNIRFVVLV